MSFPDPHIQIMLGVDRLDMVKGIPQKLLAYEKFLEEHPEWRDKVIFEGGKCQGGCHNQAHRMVDLVGRKCGQFFRV